MLGNTEIIKRKIKLKFYMLQKKLCKIFNMMQFNMQINIKIIVLFRKVRLKKNYDSYL